jgi:hypothetical protein
LYVLTACCSAAVHCDALVFFFFFFFFTGNARITRQTSLPFRASHALNPEQWSRGVRFQGDVLLLRLLVFSSVFCFQLSL